MLSLLDLKQYLQQNKIVNLQTLIQQFNAEPELLRGMLQQWERKGCVRRLDNPKVCGTSCCKCPMMVREVFEWIVG